MINLNLNKKSIAKTLKNFLLVIAGTVTVAAGTSIFLFPFDLVSGGVAGISIVLEEIFNGVISQSIIASILNWVAFFAGFLVIGRDFAIKTLVSTIVYPPALAFFNFLVDARVFDGYFVLKESVHADIAYIVASVAGGALIGLGCALSFIGGGSTGGIDVVALIACKLFPKLRSSRVLFFNDATIIILGAFVIKDVVITLLGIVSAFIAAIIIDKLFPGGQRAFIANIITSQPDRISELVIKELHRTTSSISIVGGYSGEEKKMLMVTFSTREYNQLMNIVNSTDPYAFITVHSAHKIGGQGWTPDPTPQVKTEDVKK